MFCGLEILKNDQRPIIDLNTKAGGCFGGGCWHTVGTFFCWHSVGTLKTNCWHCWHFENKSSLEKLENTQKWLWGWQSTWPRLFEEQSISKRKCLNVHTVCTNFGLNVHTVCTNLGLNVHTPVYKIKIRKCMCTLKRASEKAPGWSSMT